MVVPSLLRYWTLLLTLFFVLSLYITLLNLTITQNNRPEEYSVRVKKIVAYSLLKQIDRDSEEVECKFKKSDTILIKNNQGIKKQWDNIKNSNVFVYSVHRDVRLEPFHFIRIIAMVEGIPNSTVYCQMGRREGPIFVSMARPVSVWYEDWGSSQDYFNPYLFSCRVPSNVSVDYVRLTVKSCELYDDWSEAYPLGNPKGNHSYFTVCVKPLNFSRDISLKLIQWIEMLKILGADNFEFYVGKIRPEMKKVLELYSSFNSEVVTKDFNEIKPYDDQIWQKRRYEIIVYNDCFYRNLYTSQFVIPLDIDEIIVPSKTDNWKKLILDLLNSYPALEDNVASLSVPNAYYFQNSDTGKETVDFFRLKTRSELSQKEESCKSFIFTKNALTVFNHYALDVLRPGIGRTFFLPSDIVQMNHYRVNCSAVILPECMKYLSSPIRIKDYILGKYRKKFYRNYEEVIRKLKFIM